VVWIDGVRKQKETLFPGASFVLTGVAFPSVCFIIGGKRYVRQCAFLLCCSPRTEFGDGRKASKE